MTRLWFGLARMACVTMVVLSFAGWKVSAQSDSEVTAPDPEFQQWLQQLIAEAREVGISEDIIDQALTGLAPIPQVVSNDRNQAEFVETLAQYLDKRVTDWRIQTGRTRMAQHRDVLNRRHLGYRNQLREFHRRHGRDSCPGHARLRPASRRLLSG
jgi:membrane-bound lytic murein transglycosylase B